ncbi:MAG: phosphate ABC transporter permease PstA [Armatimonadetes bacterium]|nr:phosphate ABC transporter permease PstA [Armatimonadota bacterium]
MTWDRQSYRRLKNAFALTVCTLMAVAAVLPLFAVLFHVARLGITHIDLDFFTKLPAPVGEEGGGLANAVVGTLVLVGLASCIGVPVGVLAGVLLARASGWRWSFWVRYAADVLSGVPSIVVGVVVYELVVVKAQTFSAYSGGIALAMIMIPTVVRTTEEMIRMVPYTLYEAALALGVPEWRATVAVLVRGASAGIITGIMLAAARVAGETAPLLFTAFNNNYWSKSLSEPIASLPLAIYNYALSPYETWHAMAWAASLVLVSLVLGMSILTRVVTRGKYEIIQ